MVKSSSWLCSNYANLTEGLLNISPDCLWLCSSRCSKASVDDFEMRPEGSCILFCFFLQNQTTVFSCFHLFVLAHFKQQDFSSLELAWKVAGTINAHLWSSTCFGIWIEDVHGNIKCTCALFHSLFCTSAITLNKCPEQKWEQTKEQNGTDAINTMGLMNFE